MEDMTLALGDVLTHYSKVHYLMTLTYRDFVLTFWSCNSILITRNAREDESLNDQLLRLSVVLTVSKRVWPAEQKVLSNGKSLIVRKEKDEEKCEGSENKAIW